MVREKQKLELEKILNEKQIHHILKQSVAGDVPWVLTGTEVRPAIDGIAGFTGDHMKAVLHVDVQGVPKKVHLFIKCLPITNKPKMDTMVEINHYRREVLMYNVLEEICDDGPNPWCVKAYIYTDSMLVMRDLTVEGYKPRHYLDTLDREHVIVAVTAAARFHAAFVNYETKKSINLQRPYNTLQEFSRILAEPTHNATPWLRAAAKLTANLIRKFSAKSYRHLSDLESKVYDAFLEACHSLTEYKDTVNVLLHKDLYLNNIMFKYEDGTPTNAVLVDYQCLRYGPPAYDVMMHLYLTTDKKFRTEYEKDVIDHYYSTFDMNLNESSKKRLADLGYDKEDCIKWSEKGRMFGMFLAAGIYPYILMDPKTAEKVFDDPETYGRVNNEDRTEPVLAHATECPRYRQRNLDICEEFIETYLLKQL